MFQLVETLYLLKEPKIVKADFIFSLFYKGAVWIFAVCSVILTYSDFFGSPLVCDGGNNQVSHKSTVKGKTGNTTVLP